MSRRGYTWCGLLAANVVLWWYFFHALGMV